MSLRLPAAACLPHLTSCCRGQSNTYWCCSPSGARRGSLSIRLLSAGWAEIGQAAKSWDPGKTTRCLGRPARRGMAGWGAAGEGGCGLAARWLGGRLSERITIKCGLGPSSLTCSSLERKLDFKFAFLRKEDAGERKWSFGPSAAKAPLRFLQLLACFRQVWNWALASNLSHSSGAGERTGWVAEASSTLISFPFCGRHGCLAIQSLGKSGRLFLEPKSGFRFLPLASHAK